LFYLTNPTGSGPATTSIVVVPPVFAVFAIFEIFGWWGCAIDLLKIERRVPINDRLSFLFLALPYYLVDRNHETVLPTVRRAYKRTWRIRNPVSIHVFVHEIVGLLNHVLG
jgi:hypothetical protein